MKNKEVEEIRGECRAHVESQLDLHFCSIAEDFDVESGDITPEHMEEHLDAIKHDHYIFNHQVYLKRVKALRTARAKIQKQV